MATFLGPPIPMFVPSETNFEPFQTRHSPIIVGEQYELAETIGQSGENHAGLSANTDYQAALLSMSGYKDHGPTDMNVYDVRKPSQIYASVGPDYNSGRAGSTDGSQYLYSNQIGLPDSPDHGSGSQALYGDNVSGHRSSYDSSRSSFDDYNVRKLPEVKSYNPPRGFQGSHVYVFLRSEHDLLASPRLAVSLMFAKRSVPANIARLETQGPAYQYCVTADAPNFSETESQSTQIQLRLHIDEQAGQTPGLVDVGYFQYVSNMPAQSQQDSSRKRKLSMDPIDTSAQYDGNYSLPSGNSMSYAQNISSRYPAYSRPAQRYPEIATRRSSSITSNSSRPFLQQSTSHGSMYSSSQYINGSGGRPLTLDGTLGSSDGANPPLIRTSTLQQSNPSTSTGASGAFNPYAMYPQKAVLKLRGNLNSMVENWTPEEWTAKRRLVQFWRSQNKSTINAEFAPVKPEDRQPNSICISCIWWEERQECFATSVDTIYLLEQLVALRFTVEEKNRIRRNLEGFKPLTVAKGKADSEEFFKVIMGFPNPKPRNIEKDVKVFEWKILAGALKKIMSKYSASYSSTAGTLPQARSNMYSGFNGDSNASGNSSRTPSGSTNSSAYATTRTLKSNAPSPHTLYDGGPLSSASSMPTMGPQTPSYASPHMPMSAHSMHHGYSDGSPVPGLSHSYTAPIERSRSSQDPSLSNPDADFLRYAKRPRANTTTAAPIYTSHGSPMTHAGQHGHGSTSHSYHAAGAPSYGTPNRTYSESHSDMMHAGGLAGLASLSAGMAPESFTLMSSDATAAS